MKIEQLITRENSRKEYLSIHDWIRVRFGKAHKCESPDCSGESLVFDWALIKGKTYKRDRGHFMQLCRSCHIKYDMTQQRKDRLIKQTHTVQANAKRAESLRGRKHSEERRNNISKARRKKTKKYNYKGTKYSLVELSEMVGISIQTIWRRINKGGWSVTRAVETPVLTEYREATEYETNKQNN